MKKRFPGLKELPAVEGPILAGIATELIGINPMLVASFHKGRGKVPYSYRIKQEKDACGFVLKLRRAEIAHVAIFGNVVQAHYEWNGIVIPACPVPDKPGYEYRATRDSKQDTWMADLQDPKDFQYWADRLLEAVKERLDYLEGRRLKAVQEKAFRLKQAQIARECSERWKARWEAVEANMYVI